MARGGVEPARGFVAVTSRASCEVVDKTPSRRLGLLAATSAPNGLAIRCTAKQLG